MGRLDKQTVKLESSVATTLLTLLHPIAVSGSSTQRALGKEESNVIGFTLGRSVAMGDSLGENSFGGWSSRLELHPTERC